MRTLLIAALLLAGTARAEPLVSVSMDATVESSTITLGEIAQLHDVPAGLAEQLGRLDLGSAAPPAKHRVLSGPALRERIAALDPEIRAELPDRIRVHTAYREISQDRVRTRLEQAIRHRMPWPADAVELADWSLPLGFAVPARNQKLIVHFRPDESYLGRVNAELEFVNPTDPDAPRVRRSASAELSVRLPVVVSTSRLRRGTVLDDTHVRMETRDLRRLPQSVIRDAPRAIGQRLARNLPEGAVLLRGHLQAEPIVRRGDVIRVEVAAGNGLDVIIEARALEKGALGERIRLENPSTRRRFQAEIRGAGRARLERPGVGSR